jgi:F0F1-type ATP synthase assembly protein I
MSNSNFMRQPDESPSRGEERSSATPPHHDSEEAQPPELPPIPELPEVPEVHFERPQEPSRSPRVVEASRGMAIAFSVGFALTGPIILGALLGIWLDARFKTSPWFTMGLLLLGIVAGFVEMIRSLNRLQREQERKP